MNKNKVVIIGIDGATFDLILPWVKKGYLPTFEKLLNEGSWGELDSGVVPHSAIAWPSFYTGKNLGKHGIYNFYMMDYKGDGNKIKHFNSNICKEENVWETITRQGKRSVSLNVPMTYPPSKINGVFVSSFQTPADRKDYVYPQEYREKLNEISDSYQFQRECVSPKTDLKEFYNGVKEITAKQFKVLKYFLAKKDWDCLSYVFRETDPLQHNFWHYMDKEHPEYEKDEKKEKLILEFYKTVDKYLDEIIRLIDDNTTLIVMSDHGMGKRKQCFYLNNWLRKEGYLKIKDNLKGKLRKAGLKLGICEGDLYNFLIKNSPIGKVRELFSGEEIEKKTRYFYRFKEIDWERTQAYAMGLNQLSINLKGREPEGIVSEEGYDVLVEELKEKLKDMKDHKGGSKLCKNVYKKDEIYWGDNLDKIPDIAIDFGGSECFSPGSFKIASSNIMGTYREKAGHKREGICIMYGKGVKNESKLEEVKLTDIAPTTLSLLDLGIPKDYDGRVIKEAFKSDDIYTEKYIEPVYKKKETEEYTDEEIEGIEEHLKSLGYL